MYSSFSLLFSFYNFYYHTFLFFFCQPPFLSGLFIFLIIGIFNYTTFAYNKQYT